MVENLVADDLDHFEGSHGLDGVDEHVAVDADEVLGIANPRRRWVKRRPLLTLRA